MSSQPNTGLDGDLVKASEGIATDPSDAIGKHLMAASPDCIKVLSPDGIVLSMNDAGAKLLDIVDPSNVYGRSKQAAVRSDMATSRAETGEGADSQSPTNRWHRLRWPGCGTASATLDRTAVISDVERTWATLSKTSSGTPTESLATASMMWRMMSRSSELAVMSRKVSSSAPAAS